MMWRKIIKKYVLLLVLFLITFNIIVSTLATSYDYEPCLPTTEYFECDNGECISKEYHCDGEKYCFDESDERNCTGGIRCRSSMFQCDDGDCTLKENLCDLHDDCKDGSDETNCTNRVCGEDEFRCNSGQCTRKGAFYEGAPDCQDGSDENNSRKCTAYGRSLRCQSGQCVNSGHKNSSVCDGMKDCRDGSEEARCKSGNICDSKHAFKCTANEGECVPKEMLCNSKPDCPDGSDENQLNCPSGAKPSLWATFWRWSHRHESHNQNVSLKYSDQHLAIYAEEAIVTSVTWPEPLLSNAWKYSKDTYSHIKDNSLLYVVYGKNTVTRCYEYSSVERGSGFRNLIDCQIRERNAWTIKNAANFELVFSNLGTIIKNGAEGGNKNYAQSRCCGDSFSDIIFYDIYVHLKGETPDVIKWREGKQIKIHGKFNCFCDWFLPIHNNFGKAATFNKFFVLMHEITLGKEKRRLRRRSAAESWRVCSFLECCSWCRSYRSGEFHLWLD